MEIKINFTVVNNEDAEKGLRQILCRSKVYSGSGIIVGVCDNPNRVIALRKAGKAYSIGYSDEILKNSRNFKGELMDPDWDLCIDWDEAKINTHAMNLIIDNWDWQLPESARLPEVDLNLIYEEFGLKEPEIPEEQVAEYANALFEKEGDKKLFKELLGAFIKSPILGDFDGLRQKAQKAFLEVKAHEAFREFFDKEPKQAKTRFPARRRAQKRSE